mgnify:CR=1 FL=1
MFVDVTDIEFLRVLIWVSFLLIFVEIICVITQKIAPTASGMSPYKLNLSVTSR